MHLPALILETARWSARPPNELDTRSRVLRRVGMLRLAGFGQYAAANNGPCEIANFVMSLAGRKATEAADTVMIYSPMLPLHESTAIAGTFGEAVSKILSEPLLAEGIQSIVLARTGGGHGPDMFAKIIRRDQDRPLRGRNGDDRAFGACRICRS
jgi:hypothetical protein